MRVKPWVRASADKLRTKCAMMFWHIGWDIGCQRWTQVGSPNSETLQEVFFWNAPKRNLLVIPNISFMNRLAPILIPDLSLVLVLVLVLVLGSWLRMPMHQCQLLADRFFWAASFCACVVWQTDILFHELWNRWLNASIFFSHEIRATNSYQL